MAAVLMREHMIDVIRNGSGVAPFGHTFSGNPLGAAACLAVLDHLERNKVLDNVRQRGEQLETGLLRLAAKFPFVADVRGRGLLWGFEFLADPWPRSLRPRLTRLRACSSKPASSGASSSTRRESPP